LGVLVMMQVSKGALLALVWLALALVSRSLAHGATETLPVWLGSGVTFAVLLVGPRWTWPALLAGAALASLVWGVLAHQLSLLAALAFAGVSRCRAWRWAPGSRLGAGSTHSPPPAVR
jgi:integral membrane sensor domain MASE1